jgi:hypothetical protein
MQEESRFQEVADMKVRTHKSGHFKGRDMFRRSYCREEVPGERYLDCFTVYEATTPFSSLSRSSGRSH